MTIHASTSHASTSTLSGLLNEQQKSAAEYGLASPGGGVKSPVTDCDSRSSTVSDTADVTSVSVQHDGTILVAAFPSAYVFCE